MAKKLDLSEFIARAIEAHGDTYDYSKVVYISSKTKVEIICKEHGSFWMRASAHSSAQAQRCPKCKHAFCIQVAAESLRNSCKARKATAALAFESNALTIHEDTYRYNKTSYMGAGIPLTITCKIHGDFYMSPSEHISKGRGCPKCKNEANTLQAVGNSGFIKFYTKPTTLYYVSFELPSGTYYKIGITTQSLEKRFSGYPKYSVISTQYFEEGQEAFLEEQRILKKFSKYIHKGPKVLPKGNTELFTTNILLKQGGAYV